MRAFITGITGFIGSHVAELLLREGHQVLGVAPGGWHADAPTALTDAVELLPWDIRIPANDNLVSKVSALQPTAIFHFAAISIPALCGGEKPTDQANAVNVTGTANLLDLAEQVAKSPRVVFSSTSHVYGRVDRATARVTEDSKLDPISAYGQTKFACEQQIRQRVSAGRIEAVIARGFHHIGPRQPSGLMLTDWLEQLSDPEVREIQVRSTNSYLDMIDVRDAAVAYRLLATKGQSGEIYNLGSGNISNSGVVLKDILSIVERDVSVNAASNDERWNAIADNAKLCSIGWNPKIEYSQSVRDMLASG